MSSWVPGVENSFLRSKFARRIFLLFIISAIIPVVLVAVLSYFHTTEQLRDQNNRQSLVISRNIGIEVFGRLVAAEKVLLAVADRLRDQQADSAYGPVTLASDAAPSFSTLAVISGSGNIVALHGELNSLPALSDEQHRQLEAGRSLRWWR